MKRFIKISPEIVLKLQAIRKNEARAKNRCSIPKSHYSYTALLHIGAAIDDIAYNNVEFTDLYPVKLNGMRIEELKFL